MRDENGRLTKFDINEFIYKGTEAGLVVTK